MNLKNIKDTNNKKALYQRALNDIFTIGGLLESEVNRF